MKYNRYKMQKEISEKLKVSSKGDEFINYPIPGRKYQHYKGGLYEVKFLSTHTETGEVLVNYTSLLFGTNYSKPLSIWNKRPEKDKLRFLLQQI